MAPRRRDSPRKAAAKLHEMFAKATTATSFHNRPRVALSEFSLLLIHRLLWYSKERNKRHVHLYVIRDAYLRALQRLPPSLFPALIAGGHCFGPLPDPVSNILVNTIWLHAAASPARFAVDDRLSGVVVDLHNLEMGSLAGLDLAGDDYYAAAHAAKHPHYESFARFAESGVATSPAVTDLLNSSFRLSPQAIERLSALLAPPSMPPLDAPLVRESKFKLQHEMGMTNFAEETLMMVDKAMRHFTAMIAGPELEVHAVCDCLVIPGCNYFYHFNFIARPKDDPDAMQLFFAELGRDGVSLCCPVEASMDRSGHCIYCEHYRIPKRIIHPSFGLYHACTPLHGNSLIIDTDLASLLNIRYTSSFLAEKDLQGQDQDSFSDSNSSIEEDYVYVL